MGCPFCKPAVDKSADVHVEPIAQVGVELACKTAESVGKKVIPSKIEIDVDLADMDFQGAADRLKNDIVELEAAAVNDLSESVKTVTSLFQGASFKISVAFPVELFGRAVANTMIKVTEGSDFSRILKDVLQSKLDAINEKVDLVRKESLHAAGDSVAELIQKVPELVRMENKGDKAYPEELNNFVKLAEKAVDAAKSAFLQASDTEVDDKIRATTFRACAVEASSMSERRGNNMIAIELTGALKKLFDDPSMIILIAQECGDASTYLSSKPKRQRRLKEALCCLVHAEAWVATHTKEQPTIISQFEKPFDMQKVMAHGVLSPSDAEIGMLGMDGVLSPSGTGDKEAFSDKELAILQSYCRQKPLIDTKVLSGSVDKTLKLWQVSSGTCERTVTVHEQSVTCVTMAGEDLALSGSYDKTLKLWQVSSGTCQRTFTGHTKIVTCVTMAGEGLALSGSYDTTLKLWQVSSGTCQRTFTGHTDNVTCVTMAGEDLAVSGAHDKTLKLWQVSSGSCERTFTGHTGFVNCVTMAGEGLAVSGSYDKTLKLWQVSSGSCERTFTGHENIVTCVTMAGEDLALSGSDDKTLRLWEVSSGTCQRIFTGHADTVYKSGITCVTMVGEDLAVSGALDKTLKLWQVSSGTCQRTLTGHDAKVLCVTMAEKSLIRKK